MSISTLHIGDDDDDDDDDDNNNNNNFIIIIKSCRGDETSEFAFNQRRVKPWLCN